MSSPAGVTTHDGGRILIVNADDFGMSLGVNEGIVEAHVRGIVTSASLMVRRRAAQHAVSLAEHHPALSVGLHIDLGEWELRHGEWHLREWVADRSDRASVEAEVDGQLERFRYLTGRNPTHLDSHQHVHLSEPVRSVLRERGENIGVPVRGLSNAVTSRGDFYGLDRKGSPCPESISAQRLAQIIWTLPVGVTELGCHPGDPAGLEDPYGEERLLELNALCDPLVREEVERRGVDLASFHELRAGREAPWPGG